MKKKQKKQPQKRIIRIVADDLIFDWPVWDNSPRNKDSF